MSVGSVSGGGYSAQLYSQRLASGVRVKGSGSGSESSPSSEEISAALQKLAQQGGGGGDGGVGGPGGEGAPKIPDALKSKLDSALKSGLQAGTSPEDLKKTIDTTVSDFVKSDDYKSLSAEDRKSVDEFVSLKDKGPQGAGGFNPFSQLEQAGANTRESVLSKFNFGGGSTSSDSVNKTLLDLLSQRETEAA